MITIPNQISPGEALTTLPSAYGLPDVLTLVATDESGNVRQIKYYSENRIERFERRIKDALEDITVITEASNVH